MNCNMQGGKCTHCGGSEGGVCKVKPATRREGLGDYTERVLHKLGVTSDNYAEVKKKFGLAPNCGCRKRRDWMNKVSDWFRVGGQ